MPSPLIICLDIDGTLIGDITPQVMMYEMGETLIDVPALHNKLRNGIVRPHLDLFFRVAKERGVELFIYTASQKKWAEYLVRHVELAYNVKFNRPLFTRCDCKQMSGTQCKSLDVIKDRVVRSLQRKYTPTPISTDHEHMIIIDNNNVFPKDDQSALVLCPSYKFMFHENLPVKVNCAFFNENRERVCNVMRVYMKTFVTAEEYTDFELQFYTLYIRHLKCHKRMSKKADTFFLDFAKKLEGVTTFSCADMRELRKSGRV